ncbi:hypothetical protein EYF80_011527 [Liparis tanakae]|uniref:Uncharacterized protein n=1 Tax=Liparis tanakae TaxID=230148 RepID=A0A4Z2IKL8_9TELE|nr:hypothetical protein EYF80_011527 [Liparis tanakae]
MDQRRGSYYRRFKDWAQQARLTFRTSSTPLCVNMLGITNRSLGVGAEPCGLGPDFRLCFQLLVLSNEWLRSGFLRIIFKKQGNSKPVINLREDGPTGRMNV